MSTPLKQLLPLIAPNGGFRSSRDGSVRPDSTAWASIVLSYSHKTVLVEQGSLDILTTFQLEDGRVCLSPEYPETSWPTSLAILAWQDSPPHQENHNRAVQFLLNSSGKHWEKKSNSVIGHDPILKGWAWIDNTHSWVETTALAIIALHNAGYETHPRLHEATNMLLDRQLSQGTRHHAGQDASGVRSQRRTDSDLAAALRHVE